jgi:TrmH family RNA methyltransferase
VFRGFCGDLAPVSVEKITSLQNPRLKQLVKLRDRRPRDEAGLFLIEGYREVKRALEAGVKPVELYCGADWFLGANEPALIEEAQRSGAQVFDLSKEAFAKVSYRDRPDGLLAVAQQWRRTLADLDGTLAGPSADTQFRSLLAGVLTTPATTLVAPPPGVRADPFFLVIEAIEKPGNLGTILRSADAAGINAVIVCDPVTDIFNPNVVRSSTGVLFSMPVVVAGSAEVCAWLRARGIRAVATTPAAKVLYSEVDLRGPLAVIMGSEQYGLSDFWLKESAQLVRIPMAGRADSLNVAMATVITLFEAVRQRNSRGCIGS